MIRQKTKKIIRLSAAALVAAVCLAFFAGCAGKEESGGEIPEKYVLCGHGISEFSVVIPENADVCEKYAAELLRDEIKELCGVTVKIITDETEESPCEILLGNTKRAESNSVPELSPDEYAVYSVGTKTVLSGNLHMVAGGIPAVLSALQGTGEISSEAVKYKWQSADAESVILLIGDGMGENHIKMAEASEVSVVAYDGEVRTPEEKGGIAFAAKDFPNCGRAATLNYYGEITDSAASGTALATGYKTENGVLGMIPADLDGDGEAKELSSVQNVREAACLKGMKTAVLSTDRQTGATPNAFLVHHSDRYSYPVVLEQQTALSSTSVLPTYLMCSYDSDEFLWEMKKAIGECEGENGFFIMAEEAMIDKYSSRLDYDNVIRTVKRLNDVVCISATYAVCHQETAVIVTADHETGGLTVGDAGEFYWTSHGEHTESPVGVYAMGGGTQTLCGDVDNTDIGKYIFSVIEGK